MSRDETSIAWQHAALVAARLHAGQLRKDGQTPYVAHPFRVAITVRHVFGIDDPIALAAALLHDVIEDTTADYDEIQEEFGGEIADAVAALTKDMRLPESDREVAYDRQLAQASWQARLVKLADTYDNVCDAPTDAIRKKAAAKAKRAIACAGDDERLKGAVEIVRDLIDRFP